MSNPFADPLTFLLVDLAKADNFFARSHELEELWDAFALQPDVERLLALGKALNANGFLFWLQCWRLVIRQRLVACGVDTPPVSTRQGTLAITMLELACQGEQQRLEDMFQQIANSRHLQEAQLPFDFVRRSPNAMGER